MGNKEDLEITFVLKLIENGDKELLEMYKKLLDDRLEEAEARNIVVDKLGEEVKRFKARSTGGND